MSKRGRQEYDNVQWPITAALQTLGFRVTTLAQPQRVKASAGVPDLYVSHARWGIRAWIEAKSPARKAQKNGGLSPEQLVFIHDERAAGGTVIVAYSLSDAIEGLRAAGAPIR